MSAGSPQIASPAARLRAAQRLLSDNPAIALTFIFIALFVVTDMPLIEGLITATDLGGDKQMRVVHERHLHYDELSVADA